MKKSAIFGALFTTMAIMIASPYAFAVTPIKSTQISVHAAGHQASLGKGGATAIASALVVSEDGGSEGYIDLAITGDGAFSIAPGQMQITTDRGKTVAVSTKLTERNMVTNQRIREIRNSEIVEAEVTKNFRFEFSGSEVLNAAGNLSALNDGKGVLVAAWHTR